MVGSAGLGGPAAGVHGDGAAAGQRDAFQSVPAKDLTADHVRRIEEAAGHAHEAAEAATDLEQDLRAIHRRAQQVLAHRGGRLAPVGVAAGDEDGDEVDVEE